MYVYVYMSVSSIYGWGVVMVNVEFRDFLLKNKWKIIAKVSSRCR